MAVQPLASQVGVAPACRALGVPRASFYRRQRPAPGHQQPRPTPARALCASERAHVLDVLASPRFVDRSPAEVVATLLDEGQYLCAERTMYRILAANQPVRERRNQRSHPCYTKPELVATGPNQTWSWDITRLRGPKRWTSFYLYVLLDIFSRCVAGLDGCRSGDAAIGRDPETAQASHRVPGARRRSSAGADASGLLRPRGHRLRGPLPGISSLPSHARPGPVCSERAQDPDVHAGFPRFEDITAVIATFDEGQYLRRTHEHRDAGPRCQPPRVHHHRAPSCAGSAGRPASRLGRTQTSSTAYHPPGFPSRWTTHRHVLLDIFSRCVVGWMVPIGRTPRSPRR